MTAVNAHKDAGHEVVEMPSVLKSCARLRYTSAQLGDGGRYREISRGDAHIEFTKQNRVSFISSKFTSSSLSAVSDVVSEPW